MSDSTTAGRAAASQRYALPGSTLSTEAPIPPTPNEPTSNEPVRPVVRRGDRIFRWLVSGAGIVVVVLVGLIGVFLVVQAIPPLLDDKVNFLFSNEFSTGDTDNLRFGIRDLLQLTILSSLFALLLAMPVSLGIALFLTHYAPRRLARAFAYVIDLLAAVPSIVFGLWGIFVLAPRLAGVARWLDAHLGFIPLFTRQDGDPALAGGGNVFTAGIVLAVMILPIITAVSREVFGQTPSTHIEAALALGATRWEMVRTTVLPFGRAGYVSASMLGLGRALGETIALTTILSTVSNPFSWSLFDGGSTFASKIALAAPEFNDPKSAGAFIAAGLVLFLLTFAVNAAARAVAGKRGYTS